MTRVGLISGTGTYDWPGLKEKSSKTAYTAYGDVALTSGKIGEVEVVHLCRHGADHGRISNQVDHRANLQALLDNNVDAVVSTTVCGAVDPSLPLGSLVVFDDIYFPSNRLPDGSICTWHTKPAAPGRGHWIFGGPFSEQVRESLVEGAKKVAAQVRHEGTYGHVDGPRFNTRSEIAALASVGVTAVSQTVGPEVVLAGEAELPIAVLGFVTDYANGIGTSDEPLESLAARLKQAPLAFSEVIAAALPRLPRKPESPGTVFRFD